MDKKGSTRRRDYKRELKQRAEQVDGPQPGDEQGAFAREELEAMQQRFAEAIAREVRKGQ
jgi:hypothetical protein